MKRHFSAESETTGSLAKGDKRGPGPSWKIEDHISKRFEIYEAKSFQEGEKYVLSIASVNDRLTMSIYNYNNDYLIQ